MSSSFTTSALDLVLGTSSLDLGITDNHRSLLNAKFEELMNPRKRKTRKIPEDSVRCCARCSSTSRNKVGSRCTRPLVDGTDFCKTHNKLCEAPITKGGHHGLEKKTWTVQYQWQINGRFDDPVPWFFHCNWKSSRRGIQKFYSAEELSLLSKEELIKMFAKGKAGSSAVRTVTTTKPISVSERAPEPVHATPVTPAHLMGPSRSTPATPAHLMGPSRATPATPAHLMGPSRATPATPAHLMGPRHVPQSESISEIAVDSDFDEDEDLSAILDALM